eukprot:COSAG06_NODE_16364_length_1005_cov_1.185430_2_plen_119_part_01
MPMCSLSLSIVYQASLNCATFYLNLRSANPMQSLVTVILSQLFRCINIDHFRSAELQTLYFAQSSAAIAVVLPCETVPPNAAALFDEFVTHASSHTTSCFVTPSCALASKGLPAERCST